MEYSKSKSDVKLGQFNFDDGGVYIGGCDGGKAHGYGICTGPMGQGEFSGLWQGGFEVSGIFTWSREGRFAGQWMQGKRHGLGVENRGHWVYAGEFTQGSMGRYGVRKSTRSEAKYEGTWTHGLQDGYGRETYADLGSYQGQWMKGCRHGYGVRRSAVYSKSCFMQDHGKRRSSLTSTRSSYEPSSETPQTEVANMSPESHLNSDMMKATKIGHFLASCKLSLDFDQSNVKGKHSESFLRKRSRSALRLVSESVASKLNKKGRRGSDGEVASEFSYKTVTNRDGRSRHEDNNSTIQLNDDAVEVYTGQWKHDRRDGFGVCERSDGIKYEGEWVGNRRHGYGITYLPGDITEAGRYKDDIFLAKNEKRKWLSGLDVAAKKREKEKLAFAIASAQRAAQLANQKSDIANSRMESSRSKALQAEDIQEQALKDADKANNQAKEIKINDLETAMKKGQSRLTKKPSIPRHHIMMDGQDSRNNSQNRIHQSDREDGSRREQNRTSLPTSQLKTFDSSSVKSSQPIRPDTLQLKSQNYSANRSTNFLGMNSLNAQHMMTLSSTTSTIPSQISEKIDNYFSYLNEEDVSTSSISGGLHVKSSPASLSSKRHPRSVSNDSRVDIPFLMTFKRDIPEEMYNPADQSMLYSHESISGSSARNPRRLTLPSIIKNELDDENIVGHVRDASKNAEFDSGISLDMPKIKHSAINPSYNERLLIVDGQRNFVEVQSCLNVSADTSDEASFDKLQRLPKMMKLHKVNVPRRQELGSMPDVSRMSKLAGEILPWKEVELLSKQKRMELEKKRQYEEDLRKKSLVIRIGDFKMWLNRNMTGIIIAAINISLIVFFCALLR